MLERSKGWKRRCLAILNLTIALVVGAIGWRMVCLWRLPNAPEPFELAKFGRVNVADADNAMVAYREVFSRFSDLDSRSHYIVGVLTRKMHDWSKSDPEVHRWAEGHRKALEAWLPTNDRPDAVVVQPEELRMGTDLEPLYRIRLYTHLALLEGSRLEESGELAGAWRMYRAALRASRHAGRHGGTNQRLIGSGLLRLSRPRVDAWIDHPGMTPELLRKAMGDVEVCRAMTSPASEMVRAEYFSALDAVNDMDRWWKLSDSGMYSNINWLNQFGLGRWALRFVRREPERSARVLRLIATGYLAQCDRPPTLRPKVLFASLMIYDHDGHTPEPVRAISPGALEAWARDSIVMELGPFHQDLQRYLDAEADMFDHFTLKMAVRAFVIERGTPPTRYRDLLGPYLKTLPDGFEPQDVINP